ncbi:hypothetical protein VTN77DRAFT_1741 [Rasamsonia byssochlamydoides]|uniref:uncharacterized protein n=1 Tax=Rasamsonia byssochlamydoides TaxID=89139 RepID=UPI003743A15C
MRPAVRLLQPLEVPSLRLSTSLYVCSNCRQEFLPRASLNPQSRRNASDSTPFTEKVRRKLWGTDNPPGLKDPYGGEGVIERAFRRRTRGQDEQEQAPAEQPVETGEVAPPQEYTAATTWDGLQRMGHLGRWSDFPPTEADEYHGFVSDRKLVKKEHLRLAAHQTAVELCLMHELKKPLTAVCDILEHERSVFRMIWKCKIQPAEDSGSLDGRLVFPNKNYKDTLYYVFEQVGRAPELEEASEEAASKEAASEEAVDPEAIEEEDPEDLEDIEEDVRHPQPFFGIIRPRDKGFLTISLTDPATKFAFLKRFAQLTGYHFPDPVISSIKTVKQAIEYIEQVINPPPKKLADQLAMKGSLKNLPNVKIYRTRRTKTHEDEELGRKKIIEAELRRRGLIDD